LSTISEGQAMFKKKYYSLFKGKKILFHTLKWYRKKEKKLSDLEKEKLISTMTSLEKSILEKNKKSASENAKQLESLFNLYLKKSFWERATESIFTLICAIFIAILVRQMWFENYTIPSGSMRPTLKERDFLIVSKTTFGVDKPTSTGHFYFAPNLIKRGDVITLSTSNMDVKDSDYMYFYIIPGKKQFIKRLIAKPGDLLYFYGGFIYGIDKDGNEIADYQKDPWFTQLEHIPFIRFEGNQVFPESYSSYFYNNVILTQYATPIAHLKSSSAGNIGSLIINKNPPFSENFSPADYFDIWGYKNFAMARILNKSQAIAFNLIEGSSSNNEDYYLELTHHPSIKKIKIEQDYLSRPLLSLSFSVSLIPLDKEHLTNIFKSLYTCRFKVKNNFLSPAGYKASKHQNAFSPKLENVPDGYYEFQDGIAYKIIFAGITKKLPPSHPIYKYNPQNIVTLFNMGIEMNTLFAPKEKNQFLRPTRYGYFRNGDLYLMGHTVFKKDDPFLISFLSREKEKEYPFIDNLPPLLPNGKIDKEILFKYGLKIPEGNYLLLGDNHAMSSDCRDFGFVPEPNLRGKASFLYWPPQERAGKIFQPSSSWFIFPKFVIFSLFLLSILGCFLYYKKKHRLPIKFKK
jgi:signal peptidase I